MITSTKPSGCKEMMDDEFPLSEKKPKQKSKNLYELQSNSNLEFRGRNKKNLRKEAELFIVFEFIRCENNFV